MGLVDIVLDDTGHLVVLIGDRRVLPKIGQEKIGYYHFGSYPLLGRFRRQSRQAVAGFVLVGLGQGVLHVPEGVCGAQEPCF